MKSLPALLTLVLLSGCVPPIPAVPAARPVVTETDSVLDWLIDGPGYFVLTDPDSGATRYTRTGAFTVDGNGTLSTAARPSLPLTPAAIVNPEQLPDLRVTPDGAILIPASAEAQPLNPVDAIQGPIGLCGDCQPIPAGWQVVGRVTLAVFEHPEGMHRRGDGYWEPGSDSEAGARKLVSPAARAASGSDTPAWDQPGRILQGLLETSTADSLPKFPIVLPIGRSTAF